MQAWQETSIKNNKNSRLMFPNFWPELYIYCVFTYLFIGRVFDSCLHIKTVCSLARVFFTVFCTVYGIFPHSSAWGCRQSVCASMPVMATVHSCPWGGKRELLTRCEVIPDGEINDGWRFRHRSGPTGGKCLRWWAGGGNGRFEVNGTRECLLLRAECAGLRPEEYASGCFMLC